MCGSIVSATYAGTSGALKKIAAAQRPRYAAVSQLPEMPMTCPAEFLDIAQNVAETAADILRVRARETPRVEIKPDGSPVTNVDLEVEQAVRAQLERLAPDHGIRGEELPPSKPDAEYVWVVDPLDGTREFIQGLPLFGFLLALTHRGRIILGLAEQPLTGDRWLGADGHGTTRNGTPVRVRPCSRLAEATVSTMGYDSFCASRHDVLLPLRQAARATITADSFYVFGLLASGRIDLVASAGFAVHDYAALDAIVRNGGGTVTDWNGRPLMLDSDGTILAAGDARLTREARTLLGS